MSDIGAAEDRRCRGKVRHLQAGGEHADTVFVAVEQRGLLEPRDSRLHPRVVGRIVPHELPLEFLLDDLARRGHDRAGALRPRVEAAKRAEDRRYLALGQPGTGAQPELPLDVVAREEEDAAGGLPVTARAAGLLHVVLQRPGNVGMDDEADVRLVDPHAEGIGGGDHP